MSPGPERFSRSRSTRRSVVLLVVQALFLLSAPDRADARPVTDEQGQPTGGGTLAWVFGDELDLIGDMRLDLPYSLGRAGALYLNLDVRTTIERSTSDFTFLVQDLDYSLDLGWRDRRRGFLGVPFTVFVGQWGTERVDADGQPYIRYVGLGVESRGLRRFEPGLHWRIATGAVLREREVEADAILRAAARVTMPRSRRPWSRLGLEFQVDGLINDGELHADRRIGPHREFMFAGGRRVTVFLHYFDSDNPLGLGGSGWLLGFDFGEAMDGAPSIAPPDVGGSIATGGGGGRKAGRLKLRILSPNLGARTRGVLEVDGNILTAEDTGELYYLYHLGVERAAGGHVAGAYFYHRSNHQLAEPNDRVTSLNVLEAGLETAGWDRPGTRWRATGGGVDYRMRIGLLLSSSFGEDERWHARGGLRWWLPFGPWRWVPFLHAEAEAGDIERELYALGVATTEVLELRLEYRRDKQHFGRDKNAFLLTAHVGF